MRVCLVSQEYPPETGHGGIGTQTFLKAHGLADLGHEVHVLSHSVGDAVSSYRDRQVDVLRIPGPDFRLEIRSEATRWLAWSQEVAAAIDRLHSQHDFDLIDFPEYGAEGFVYLVNRIGTRPRVVVHLHGPLVMLAERLHWPDKDSEFYRVGSFMEATVVQLADAVISSSDTSRRWCEQGYGLDLGAVPIIHAGIDTDLFRPDDSRRDDRPTILFAGKVGPSKGADVLAQAAIHVADDIDDLRVCFVGREVGNTVTGLRAMAEKSGHPDLFEFAGEMSRVELAAMMAEADVFAVPSPFEGGPGYVYLEAMASGLPVVGCSGSGIEETIRPGDTGMLVPPGDLEQLEHVVRELLASPELRKAMGIRARQYAEKHADTAACVETIANLYQRAMET